MKKFLALFVAFLLAAVFASPAAAFPTLVQFDPNAGGSYSIQGINEFDWSSSGSAVVEQTIVASSVAGATTYDEFLAGAVTGDWVQLSVHAQATLRSFDDTAGNEIADFGLGSTYEVTGTLDITETAIFRNDLGFDELIFTDAAGTFAYYLDSTPDAVVTTGAGFADGDAGADPFLYGSVVAATGGFDRGTGSSFLTSTIDGYNSDVIEADPLSNQPLVGSTFDTTLTLFHSGDMIEVGGEIGGLTPRYTVEADDIILNADANSQFSAIPEPGTMVLFGIGLLSLAGTARRKRA